MTTKIPMIAAARRTYGFLWEHREHFVRVSWPWVLGLVVATTAAQILIGAPAATMSPDSGVGAGMMTGSLLSIAISLFSVLVGAAVAVTWHRTLLLGPTADGADKLNLDRRTLIYFGYVMLINLVVGLVAGLAGALLGGVLSLAAGTAGMVLGFGVGFLLVGYLTARWTMLFPAIAVGDDSVRITRSWEATRGNGWRILLGSLLAMVPIMIVYLILLIPLTVMAMGGGSLLISMVMALIQTPLSFLIGVILAGYMSLCYDVLIRGGGPGSDQSSMAVRS